MRYPLVTLTLFSVLTPSHADFLTALVEKLGIKPDLKETISTKEENSSLIPFSKDPYKISHFARSYSAIFNSEIIDPMILEDQCSENTLKTLAFILSYSKQLHGVIPQDIAIRILDYTLGQHSRLSGKTIREVLEKLGEEAIYLFTKILDDLMISQLTFFSHWELSKDPCTWVPLLELFPHNSLSAATLAAVFTNVVKPGGERECNAELKDLVQRNLKSIIPKGGNYHIDTIFNNLKAPFPDNPMIDLAGLESPSKAFHTFERRIEARNWAKENATWYHVVETWHASLQYSILSFKSKMKSAYDKNYVERLFPFGHLFPEAGLPSRSNASYRQMIRYDNMWRKRLYLNFAFKERKEVNLLILEYVFNHFITGGEIKGTFTRYCAAAKELLHPTKTEPFWNAFDKHFVRPEDVTRILCSSQKLYMRNYKTYLQKFVDPLRRLINEEAKVKLPTINSTTVSRLKSLNALGLFITECMIYDLYPLIEHLFSAGVTIDEFLALDELHFFLLDAKPAMLYFIIGKINFASLPPDRAIHFWKEILSSINKLRPKQTKKFLYKLLTCSTKGSKKIRSNFQSMLIEHIEKTTVGVSTSAIKEIIHSLVLEEA